MSSLVVQSRPRRSFSKSFRKLSRGILAWLLSFLIHMGGTIGLGLITSSAPDGVRGPSRSIELTLIDSDSQTAGEAVNRVVFAAAQSAPALLEQPQPLPSDVETRPAPMSINDQNVAPASYSALEPPPPASPTPAAPQHTATQLFGIRGYGRRFVYVFDRSSSMEGRALEAAKMQLAQSLGDLTSRDQFQVVCFNDHPLLVPTRRGSFSGMLASDDPSKRLALQYVGGIFAEGPTNHLTALAAALELRPDVIFFLTDAAGETLRPDHLASIRRLNRTATIHTIEFEPAGPPPTQPSFLAILAMENGGQHTYIEVTRLR